MKPTPEMIEAHAIADAKFAGMDFAALGRADKKRYLERSACCLSAALSVQPAAAAGVPIDRYEAMLDSQYRAGAKAGWNAAHLPEGEANAKLAELTRVEKGALAALRTVQPEAAVVGEPVAWLHAVVDAWEALPGGRQVRNRDVEAWLAKDMSPAINAIRGFLRRSKPDGTLPPPPPPEAARDVLAERERQKTAEGWTTTHDDNHTYGEMARAAAVYALASTVDMGHEAAAALSFWPWDQEWFKPTDERRSLVKAGALILAEIERLDRAALETSKEGAQ